LRSEVLSPLQGASEAGARFCESVYASAWRVFQQGQVLNESLAAQLRALGGEVARAAEHFAAGRITSPEAGRAEATLQPVSDAEVRRAR
jgi:hypothetical protein